MSEHQSKNRLQFFDEMAANYKGRFTDQFPFLFYFYNQRLVAACRDLSFHEETRLIDYGAGTGFLYDYLLSDDYSLSNYIGIDISADMLNQSKIPVSQREVGGLDRLKKQQAQDYIFSLGVTTYMTEIELVEFLGIVREKLQKDGSLIISFTNKQSLDFKIISTLRQLMPKQWTRKQSLGYPSVLAFSPTEATELLAKSGFRINQMIFLNQTVFPLNRLFPRLAVFIAQRFLSKSRRPFWSSDFLIHASISPQ